MEASSWVTLVMGSNKTTIPLDWEFKGRLIRGFNTEYTLPIRLELDDDDGVQILFHAVKVETLFDQLLNDIKADLEAKLFSHQWQVYAGTF
jgi:hypothetical protein